MLEVEKLAKKDQKKKAKEVWEVILGCPYYGEYLPNGFATTYCDNCKKISECNGRWHKIYTLKNSKKSSISTG